MPRSPGVGDRVRRVLAVLLVAVATSLALAAYDYQLRPSQRRDALSSPLPAALTSAPPLPAPSSAPTSPSGSAGPASSATVTHTLVDALVPRHLFIPRIGVNTSVAAKPTELARDPFLGRVVPSFGVPDDLYTTTWWSSGPEPGSAGMAVVLGHTQIGGYGVFNHLGELRSADVIGLTRGKRTLTFRVLSVRTGISKNRPQQLRTVLAHHPAAARLALLTCSGTFNGGYRASAENTVVFATLVATT